MDKSLIWQQEGREHLELKLDMDGESINEVTMKAIGSLSFLKLSQEMKAQLKGSQLNPKNATLLNDVL